MHQIQKNILQEARTDSRRVPAWVYNDQNIAFDFLLNDYFVSISYVVLGQTFNFIGCSESKVSRISSFPGFPEYISETCGSYPQSVNQANTVLSFKFAEVDWARIEAKFNEVLKVTSIYFDSKLYYVPNIERDNGINLTRHLDKSEVEYAGIQGNSNKSFLNHARSHGLSDYVYESDSKDFLAVKHKVGASVSHRVNKHSYKDLLAYLPDSFHELGNMIYTVEAPEVLNTSRKNLLALFSYTNKSNEDVADHYYSHPFPFISNNIMSNIYTIRMTDVSDAFGSHGLNIKLDESIEASIQNFIKNLTNTYSADKESIVIYGASLGSTGAVYRGLMGGHKTFTIDPFLDNHKYYGGEDSLYLYSIHVPTGKIFRRLPDKIDHDLESQVVIPSTKMSEFYPDIKELKEALPTITLYEFDFGRIQERLDFSGNTVSLSSTIINNLLLGVRVTDSDTNLS